MAQNRFFSVLLILCFFSYKSVYAFDSMMEFESSNANNCAELQKVLSAEHLSSLSHVLNAAQKNQNQEHLPMYPTWMGFISEWMSGTKLYLYSVIDFGLNDICANTYIVQPHEYVNLHNGWTKCEANEYGVSNKHLEAVNQHDVPFYYSCDPTWNPSFNTQVYNGEDPILENNWGYMGHSSSLCLGKAQNYALKELVGSVRVEYADRFAKESTKCTMREGEFLRAGESKKIKDVIFTAFHHYNTKTGKVQLCVATPYTSIPIIVGCSSTAPLPEKWFIDNKTYDQIRGTKCDYLLTGRTDLWALGEALPELDEHSFNGKAIKLFLQSEFHTTSTVVNCIKDLINKVYIPPNNSDKGLLKIVQDKLKEVVYAALTLYLVIIGIRIITSPQVPSQGEFMMFIIKFGLVFLFTSTDVWYYIENGEIKGLFAALFGLTEFLSQVFFNVIDINDPVGLCHYWFQGDELLKARNLNANSLSIESLGNAVKNGSINITVWDLVDCKFANYINLGSCNYSATGMIGMWISMASLLVAGNGFLLAIISFIYIWIMLLIMFRFTHIFILSIMVISLLVLVSPIMICFGLFQATKSIFQAWFRMIIGYSIFPGLLFVLISLIFVVFDSIYFGELTTKASEIKHNSLSIIEACENVNSIFCTTIGLIAKDPCSANIGVLGEQLIEQVDVGQLGTYNRSKYHVSQAYFNPILKLMLFSLIIYFFINAVINLFAVMSGIGYLHEEARISSVDFMSYATSLGNKISRRVTYLTGEATGGLSRGEEEQRRIRRD